MTFHEALSKVLEWEGVYDFDPDDAGGETCFGITKKYQKDWAGWSVVEGLKAAKVPHDEWIKSSKLMNHVEVYYAKVWSFLFCDSLPGKIASCVFGGAINQGPERVAMWLQESLRELGIELVVDGVIGHATCEAACKMEEQTVLDKLMLKRARAYIVTVDKYPNRKKYLFGWMKRLFDGV